MRISQNEPAPVPPTDAPLSPTGSEPPGRAWGPLRPTGEQGDATVWVQVVGAPRADCTDPDATVIRPRTVGERGGPGWWARGRLLTWALCVGFGSFTVTVTVGGLLVRAWLESPEGSPPPTVMEVEAAPVPVVFDFGALAEELQRAQGSVPVTSGFGLRQHPVSRAPAHHAGVDLDLRRGEPIAAGSPGVVTFAGWRGGYGRLVEVDHGDGVTTRYAHCDTLAVKVGDAVEVGDRIGTVGSTGRVTGPHLHFEVRLEDRPVDPEDERWLELHPLVGDYWSDEQLARKLRPAL